jgi:hypothetical protein
MQTLIHLSATLLTALWLIAGAVAAEDAQTPLPPETPAKAQSADAQQPQASSEAPVPEQEFPPEQIEQLVAPIALYPDALLAQILMAATYPLDIVQAARWVKENPDLEGEALEKAADENPWDPSIKSLVFFPDVLDFMNDNLDWTQDLGDAVLAQQDDVTDAVQKLRNEAQTAGNLETTEQQRVETQGDTIVIQPAEPEVVYVPTYNPSEVYGQPAPTTTYYPTTYVQPTTTTTTDSSSDSLVSFGAGALVGGLLTAAILWDNDDDYRIYYGGRGYYGRPGYWGRPNYWSGGWRKPEIDIDRSRTINAGDINVNRGIVGNDFKKWEHNPERRGGVRYRNTEVKNQYERNLKNTRLDRDAARGREKLAKGDVKLPERGTTLQRPDGKRADKRDIKRPEKIQAKDRPKRDIKKPESRPAKAQPNRDIKKPEKRPAKAQPNRDIKTAQRKPANRPQARAPTSSGQRHRSAYKVNRGSKTRAASNRGSRSRGVNRSGGGRARGGGRGGRRG